MFFTGCPSKTGSRPEFHRFLVDLGSVLGPCGLALGGLLVIFLEVLLDFLLDFGAGMGSQKEGPATLGVPGMHLVTFEVDRGFCARAVAFLDFRGSCSAERADFQSVPF